MRILLIDADSTIPNLALMKLGSWHKKNGDHVVLHRCNLPYYPHRKKRTYYVPAEFDIKYCSVIFEGNYPYIKGENIIFGGTGVDLIKKLPAEIEHSLPDYTLYPDNKTSYGFITRGCIRKCSFCKVPKKEGYIHKVNNIDNIVRHREVKFLDNNILAYPEHMGILQELVDKKIKCQFNQGLDIRLLNENNSKLLSSLNYLHEYIFAFDSLAPDVIFIQLFSFSAILICSEFVSFTISNNFFDGIVTAPSEIISAGILIFIPISKSVPINSIELSKLFIRTFAKTGIVPILPVTLCNDDKAGNKSFLKILKINIIIHLLLILEHNFL